MPMRFRWLVLSSLLAVTAPGEALAREPLPPGPTPRVEFPTPWPDPPMPWPETPTPTPWPQLPTPRPSPGPGSGCGLGMQLSPPVRIREVRVLGSQAPAPGIEVDLAVEPSPIPEGLLVRIQVTVPEPPGVLPGLSPANRLASLEVAILDRGTTVYLPIRVEPTASHLTVEITARTPACGVLGGDSRRVPWQNPWLGPASAERSPVPTGVVSDQERTRDRGRPPACSDRRGAGCREETGVLGL